MITYSLKVNGMMCIRCASRVEKAVGEVDGVNAVSVNLDEKTVTVTGSESTRDEVLRVISAAGYEVE